MSTELRDSIRRYPVRFFLVAFSFVLGYHLLLGAFVFLRFDAWPNYFTVHDFFGNIGLIFSGTPSWRDAARLLIQEPWLETGYANPDYYGLAEWSYLVMPSRVLVILLAGVLLAAGWVQAHNARVNLQSAEARACPKLKPAVAASGLGALLLGIASASLTWVVCCAYPSWIVLLAMLGVSTALAIALEPLEAPLLLLGLGIQLFALWWLRRNLHPGYAG